MKHYSLITLPLMLLVAACNSNGKPSAKPAQPETAAARPPTPSAVRPVQIKDDRLNAVYQQYLKLAKALTDGNASEASIVSNAVEAGAKGVPGGARLANAASKLTTASGLEEQRTHFAVLSNEMMKLIKASGLGSGKIFVDYCPMALNDKGAYWLSTNEEIRNPYFGDAMLACGEVRETIKEDAEEE